MDSPTPPCDLTVPPLRPPVPPSPQPKTKPQEVTCKICKMTLKNEQEILVKHCKMLHRAEFSASRAARAARALAASGDTGRGA